MKHTGTLTSIVAVRRKRTFPRNTDASRLIDMWRNKVLFLLYLSTKDIWMFHNFIWFEIKLACGARSVHSRRCFTWEWFERVRVGPETRDVSCSLPIYNGVWGLVGDGVGQSGDKRWGLKYAARSSTRIYRT